MISFVVILMSCLLLLLLAVVILVRWYLVVVTVESGSMAPVLQPGDRLLVVRRLPKGWLRKGRIVLLWPSHIASTQSSLFEVKPYIKRIVALAGETLTLSLGDAGTTNHSHQPAADDQPRQRTWHIPEGHIFVRGDNRQASLNSLTWGPIPVENVLGVVFMHLPSKAFPPPPTPLPFHELPPMGLPVGGDAPPFAAQSLNGETVTLSTYNGRAVVFVFFVPGDHCRHALSLCATLNQKAAAAGISLVCVSGTGPGPTRSFVQELHLSLPVLVAPRTRNPFLQDYSIVMMPAYCFINAQGKVQSAGLLNMNRGEWKLLVESWGGQELAFADQLP